MASRRNVHYSPLSSREDDDYNGSQDDPPFTYTPKSFDKVPWKSIALALFLLFLGSGLLFLAFFISTGHMGGDQSQAYGLLGLGIVTFLPDPWSYFCDRYIPANEIHGKYGGLKRDNEPNSLPKKYLSLLSKLDHRASMSSDCSQGVIAVSQGTI